MYEPARIRSVQPPIIPIIAEMIRANPGTISLGQGVVHWIPPRGAMDAVAKFGREPKDHLYASVVGIPPLLDALEQKLWQENKIKIAPASRLVVTAGGNMAFVHALQAITDPGDEIILNAPYYFNHHMAIALADCKCISVPTDENYQLQPDLLRDAITDRTRAIVTISPNNPTGAVYSDDALYEVNQLCRESGIYHISDEAYEHFTFDGARHFSPGSIAEAADYTISLFSFSKSYGLASWRVGYMVIPDELLNSIRKIQDTTLICPPVVSQVAALGALTTGKDYVRKQIDGLGHVREMVQIALREVADFAHIVPTQGALYFYLNILSGVPAIHLAEQLIRRHKVAVIPGETFGSNESPHLRLSFGALAPQILAEGITRFTHGLKEILTQ